VHAVLAGPDLPAERTHLYPQRGQYPTPCAWVGFPTLTGARGAKTLTLPIVAAFDGAYEAQVKKVDSETARLVDALDGLKVNGQRARLQAVTTEQLGPDGATTFAVVLTYEFDLIVQTLCEQTLAEQP
jgi:hypothetical protein